MKSLHLKSPAKVNLYLKVINKRPDGFHNIETLFERINLFDDIYFKLTNDSKIRIRCNHPHVPCGPKNLVYKVAKLLQQDLGISQGVEIRINKRIPVAAGLAGGSSNAATALIGLNKLWNLGLSQKQLVGYGQTIGSDVAFFLYDYSWALGTQRGDKIKQVKIPKVLWHVLVIPKIKLYAKDVYGHLNLKLTKRNDDVTILIHHLRKNNIFGICSLLLNDLEPSIIGLCPRLLILQKRLKSLNTQGVMISGSGPCVFCLTENQRQAKKIQTILKRQFAQVFVVRTF